MARKIKRGKKTIKASAPRKASQSKKSRRQKKNSLKKKLQKGGFIGLVKSIVPFANKFAEDILSNVARQKARIG
jgi:hypothetical protein